MQKRKKKLYWAEVLVLIVVVTVLVLTGWHIWHENDEFRVTEHPLSPPSALQNHVPILDHIVVIVEENRAYETVMEGSEAPYLQKLAAENSQATKYYALFHPSLPNYLAMLGGTNGGIEDNCNPGPGCELRSENITDRIEQSGRSWKGYMEGLPEPCYLKNDSPYTVRHNPFFYYKNLTSNPERCNNLVVGMDQFYKDMNSNQLPNFAFIVPDVCNDMHDCPVKTGDDWLANLVPQLLNSQEFKNKRSLLIITWDEAEMDDDINRIPTIFAGPAVKKNYKSSNVYDHYSLLKTIEVSWGLEPFTKNDRDATALGEFFYSLQ